MENTQSRPLGSFERLFWLVDQTYATHAVLAAEIEGSATSMDWRRALDAVQARHPLLSSRIVSCGNEAPCLTQTTGIPIPLHFTPAAALRNWPSEVARQLATPFDLSKAPLVRATVLHNPGRAICILAAHHSISDGMSLVYIIRDMLRAIAGETLDNLRLPPSLDDLTGLSESGAAQPCPHADMAPAPGARAELSQRGGTIPHIEHMRFSAAFTASLAARSKLERTTVHGALSAALTLAARSLSPQWRQKSIRLLSPINLRKVLAVGEDCGLYITSNTTLFEPGQDTGFWGLARYAVRDLAHDISRESATARTAGMRQMVSHGFGIDDAARLGQGDRARDIMLTNLGHVPFESTIGKLKLLSLWGPLALSGYPGENTVGVATTNGELCMLLASRKPLSGMLAVAEALLDTACLVSA